MSEKKLDEKRAKNSRKIRKKIDFEKKINEKTREKFGEIARENFIKKHLKKYFSRLNFGYEKTLLYMLQQSEYDVREYLKWLRRVKNFREVRRRGDMIPTLKVRLLFYALTLFVLVYFAAILLIFSRVFAYFSGGIFAAILIIFCALFLIFILPILAQIVIIFPLILGDIFIKKPLAKKRILRAKKILENHQGIKIAIAGSFGKTTAKFVLREILAGGKTRAKKVAATPGNINQPLGFAKFISKLSGDEDVLIFEFGEYFSGDIAKMCEFIQPDIGFLTGINDAHLENFKTRENLISDILDLEKYLRKKIVDKNSRENFDENFAKNSEKDFDKNDKNFAEFNENSREKSIEILEKNPRKKPVENYIYINFDNEILREKFEKIRDKNDENSRENLTKNYVFYSEFGTKNLPVKNVEISAFGADFQLEKMQISSPLLGIHNVGIVAAGADFAKKIGLSENEIRAGISRLAPFEHRMKPRFLAGATIIDDTYNGNLDGFFAGINLLENLDAKRKIYITPGLVEQGIAKEKNHRKIAQKLARAKFDKIVLMKNSATKIIFDELENLHYAGEILLVENPLEFYENLDKFVAAGDVVLMQNDWTDNYE